MRIPTASGIVRSGSRTHECESVDERREVPSLRVSLLEPTPNTARLATDDVEMEGEENTFEVKEILDLEQMNQ